MNKLKYIIIIVPILLSIPSLAQVDRHDVRVGNRKFRKGNYKESEISYRKALVKDSTSFAANYNLASTLYRQEHMTEAQAALDRIKSAAPASAKASDYYYNLGNVALKQKNYEAAVEAYKESLIRNPEDMDAKENYIYAKEMLNNRKKNGGGGNNGNNKNKDNKDNKDNKNNKDQGKQNQQNSQGNRNQDGQQPQEQGQQPRQSQSGQGQQPQGGGKLSPQQAQQMLQAVQAKEKETQEKVNKEKAELLKTKQKEKNW